jgi:CRP/FNR family transcriptional regulator, anaerobic regulatory protein
LQNPIKSYLNHYKMVCPQISDDELEYISQHLTVTEYAAKDYYLKSGNVQKSIGFVISGLMRSFYINDKGNEITIWFTKENEYATDYSAYVRQSPAKYFLQCIEPTLVANLTFEDMQDGYSKFKNIERYGRLVTEEVLVMQQNRLESFLFQNAEQRYLDFIKQSPTLFNRVSLTDLASYLGIERQSLSRIRKSLSQK